MIRGDNIKKESLSQG